MRQMGLAVMDNPLKDMDPKMKAVDEHPVLCNRLSQWRNRAHDRLREMVHLSMETEKSYAETVSVIQMISSMYVDLSMGMMCARLSS